MKVELGSHLGHHLSQSCVLDNIELIDGVLMLLPFGFGNLTAGCHGYLESLDPREKHESAETTCLLSRPKPVAAGNEWRSVEGED